MRFVQTDELRSTLNLQAFLEYPPRVIATRNRRSGKALHARGFTF